MIRESSRCKPRIICDPTAINIESDMREEDSARVAAM